MASGQEVGRDSPERKETEWKLTDEERQVLKECRRDSLLRGVPLAFGAWYIVRYYGRRVPQTSHFGRSWSFYSVVAFIGAFFAGVNSYKEKCFQKIMQLEHSTLKDQVLKITESAGAQCEQYKHQNDSATRQEGPLGGHRHRRRNLGDQAHRPAEDSPGTRPQEGPRPSSQEYPPRTPQPELNEQPSAFGERKMSGLFGDENREGDPSSTSGQYPGRTFDEIRAENRKRQQFEAKDYSQQDQRGKSWSELEGQWGRDQKQAAETGKNHPRERRNKYGDIIIDDDDK